MPIYRIRKTVVVEFEIRAEDSQRAIEYAHNDYSWDADGGHVQRRVTSGLSYETEQIRIDPPCEVNDGGACGKPGVKFYEASKTWACAEHEKELRGLAKPAPRPSAAPVAVGEDIPF